MIAIFMTHLASVKRNCLPGDHIYPGRLYIRKANPIIFELYTQQSKTQVQCLGHTVVLDIIAGITIYPISGHFLRHSVINANF